MQTYSDPSRASDPTALPDVEVFELHDYDIMSGDWISLDNGEEMSPGWYYWSCFPGCLPDSDPIGPFDSADAARLAAQQE